MVVSPVSPETDPSAAPTLWMAVSLAVFMRIGNAYPKKKFAGAAGVRRSEMKEHHKETATCCPLLYMTASSTLCDEQHSDSDTQQEHYGACA